MRTRVQAYNDIKNQRRRVSRARTFMVNTCPASRHVHMMANALASGETYHMIEEEPEHVARSLYAVLESLWKARTELARLKASGVAVRTDGFAPKIENH